MAKLIDAKLQAIGRQKRNEARRQEAEEAPSVDGGGTFADACALYPIQTKEAGIVSFDPARWHEEQQRFNRERTGRDIVIKPRAVGMSTLEILRGFWQVSTRDSWNVRIVIHDRKLADGLFQIVRLAYESMRDSGRVASSRLDRIRELHFAERASNISVQEAGASVAAARNKGRSGTNHRVHATEVAFWQYPRESMTGLLGSVPKGGEILIESTANGASGWFYEEVQKALRGESLYKLHFYPWFEHSAYRSDLPEDFDPAPVDEWEERLRDHGCDDQQIQWWREKVKLLTLDKALQEFPESVATCFRTGGGEWIPSETLDKAAAAIRAPLRVVDVTHEGRRLGELLVYREPHQGETFIGGADVAEGIGKDGSGASFMSARTAEVCGTFWANDIEPGDYGRALNFCGRFFNDALIAPERNNHGHAVLEALTACSYPNLYVADDGRLGWVTSPVTRPVMWDEGWTALRDGHLLTPDAATVVEMRTIIKDARGRPMARDKSNADGAKDDRWTGLIIAWQLYQRSSVGGGVASPDNGEPEADDLGRYM